MSQVAREKVRVYALVPENVKEVNILNVVYPVGSIYKTTDDSFNPNVDFGVGVWERVEAGRFLEAGDGTDGKEKVDAGLPAPVGYFEVMQKENASSSGFNFTEKATYGLSLGSDAVLVNAKVNLNLASSNAKLFGKSSTVQPKSYKVNIWERIE